jgi:tRNA nucleotidyltransferase (CCA-adding enzyme)
VKLSVAELEETAEWNRDSAIKYALKLGRNNLSEDAVYAQIVQAHVQMVGMLRREIFEVRSTWQPPSAPMA